MSVEFVQQGVANVWGQTATVTMPAATTAGNTLVVWCGSQLVNEVGGSDPWVLVADTRSVGATAQRCGQVWILEDAPSLESVTLNATEATNRAFSASVLEFSGSVRVADSVATLNAAPTISTEEDGLALLVGFHYTGGTPTTPAGWTDLTLTTQSDSFGRGAYMKTTTAGTVSPSYGLSSIAYVGLSLASTVPAAPHEPFRIWNGSAYEEASLLYWDGSAYAPVTAQSI